MKSLWKRVVCLFKDHEGEKDARIEELLRYLRFSDDTGSHRDWVADCQMYESHLAELRAERDALLELLREAGAPVRELLWCMCVWNDHNFTHADLVRKLRTAREALGLDGINRVDDANDLLTRIDAALAAARNSDTSTYP